MTSTVNTGGQDYNLNLTPVVPEEGPSTLSTGWHPRELMKKPVPIVQNTNLMKIILLNVRREANPLFMYHATKIIQSHNPRI